MTALDDLKAAGIECPPDIIGWFIVRDDPADWYSVKACENGADSALDAALRLAIGYKGELERLRADSRDYWKLEAEKAIAARDLAHDHILQLETELAYWRGDKQPDGTAGYWYARALTAEAERDRARDLAVGLEQECAKLDAMLKLAVMTWTAGCDPDVIDVPQFVHVTDAMEWLRAELEAAT